MEKFSKILENNYQVNFLRVENNHDVNIASIFSFIKNKNFKKDIKDDFEKDSISIVYKPFDCNYNDKIYLIIELDSFNDHNIFPYKNKYDAIYQTIEFFKKNCKFGSEYDIFLFEYNVNEKEQNIYDMTNDNNFLIKAHYEYTGVNVNVNPELLKDEKAKRLFTSLNVVSKFKL